MNLRLFLRVTLPQLRITAVQRGLPPGEESAIWLGPRICWAAELAEFEQVEIFNFTRGQRCLAHVRFGREGEVEVRSALGPLMQAGDTVKVVAYVWLAGHAVAEHVATRVEMDEGNAVIEIRRVPGRLVTLDPMSFPLPPPLEFVSVPPALPPGVEAMD